MSTQAHELAYAWLLAWFCVFMLIADFVRFTAGEVNTASDIDDALIGLKAVNSRKDFCVAVFVSHKQANDC